MAISATPPPNTYTVRITVREDQPGYTTAERYDTKQVPAVHHEIVDISLTGGKLQELVGRSITMLATATSAESTKES